MATVTPDTLSDLQNSTLENFNRRTFTEIATDLREYHVFPNLVLFKDDKGKSSRMMVQGGKNAINFKVMLNHNGASRHTSMASPDAPVKVDVLDSATAPWRFTTTQYGMLQQELAMNSGGAEIVNLYKTQDIAALISLAALMETTWWGPPVDSTDTTTPYGLFTWFPKASGTPGFNGAFPSGYTTLGLDNQHARWKHYVGAYSAITDDDLFTKMWLAVLKTNFKHPVEGIPDIKGPASRSIYMNTSTYVAACKQAKSQNDNNGYDLTKGQGITTFMNTPLQTVATLDSDTTNPVIGLNWGTIRFYALQGWWLKRFNSKNYPGQHTTDAFFIDSVWNSVCVNRRENFILSNGTTYPS